MLVILHLFKRLGNRLVNLVYNSDQQSIEKTRVLAKELLIVVNGLIKNSDGNITE
jgi:hypothetical protein